MESVPGVEQPVWSRESSAELETGKKNLSIKIKQKLAIHGEAISGFPSSLPSTHRKAFAIGKAGLSS